MAKLIGEVFSYQDFQIKTVNDLKKATKAETQEETARQAMMRISFFKQLLIHSPCLFSFVL